MLLSVTSASAQWKRCSVAAKLTEKMGKKNIMVYFKETVETVFAPSAFNSFPRGAAAATTKQQLKTPIVLARQGQKVWQLLKLE